MDEGAQEIEQPILGGVEGGTGLGSAVTKKSDLLLKQKGVAFLLEKSLSSDEKVLPPEVPFNENNVPASFDTNETVPDENFFKLVKMQIPMVML